MKAAYLLISAPALLILGLVSAFQAFHGQTHFGLGFPFSRNWIDISVKAAGGWVALGFVLAFAGTIAYVWGLIKVLRLRVRGEQAAAAAGN